MRELPPGKLSVEQRTFIDQYLLDLMHDGKCPKTSVRQMARELRATSQDGVLVLLNPKTGALFGERSVRDYIQHFIDHWRGTDGAYNREIKRFLMQAAFDIAKDMKSNSQLAKIMFDKFMPDGERSGDNGTKSPLSPGAVAILQQNPMGTRIYLGQGEYVEGVGDKGHERSDTGDIVADGQRQDIIPEALPVEYDKAIHGVHKGGDTTQGSPLSATEVPYEDSVDNDSGGDMGSTE